MKVCSSCGQQVDDAAFCPKCGEPQGAALSATVPVAGPPAFVAQAPYYGDNFAPAMPMGPIGSQWIGKWNWGAALLSQFWLMNHRKVWQGVAVIVVSLIPIVSIVNIAIFFYMGINGNRIAVASGRFTSEEQFVAVQNAWRNWGIGVFFVGLVLGIVLGIAEVFANMATHVSH